MLHRSPLFSSKQSVYNANSHSGCVPTNIEFTGFVAPFKTSRNLTISASCIFRKNGEKKKEKPIIFREFWNKLHKIERYTTLPNASGLFA